MQRPKTVANQISQEALDALLAERLDWAARFASAVAHDMGNLALIASIMESDPGAQPRDPKTRELQQNLLLQIRAMIDAVDLWRSARRLDVQACSLKDWWTIHGRLVRQFLPSTTRVSVQTTGEGATLDAVVMGKAMAAMLVAISAQVHPLEKVAITISSTSVGETVNVDVETFPSGVNSSLLLPTLLQRHIATDEQRTANQVRIESSSLRLRFAAPIRTRADQGRGQAAPAGLDRPSLAK